MIVERIPLSSVVNNCGTQMRAEVMEKIVEDYATCIESLPPVTVFFDGSRYMLADGFHRLAAHIRAGASDIACDVKAGTLRDAVLYAAGANATHGHRRTNADKRRAIETLLRDQEWRQKSDRWIADVAKVSQPFVSGVRNELYPQQAITLSPDKTPAARHATFRTGRDGKQYPATKPTGTAEQVPDKSVLNLFRGANEGTSATAGDSVEQPETAGEVAAPAATSPESSLFRKAAENHRAHQYRGAVVTTAEVLRVSPVESRPQRTHEEDVAESQRGALAMFASGDASAAVSERSILERMREVKQLAKSIQRDIAAAGSDFPEDAAVSWDLLVAHAINAVKEAGGGDE